MFARHMDATVRFTRHVSTLPEFLDWSHEDLLAMLHFADEVRAVDVLWLDEM